MSQISSASQATLTAMFETQSAAQDAVDRLVAAGVPSDSIRLLPGYENDSATAEIVDTEHVHRGFFESLANFFMPEEDRYSYAEGLRRGGYMVSVTGVSAGLHDTALDILDDEGAINLDEAEESWRAEGWSGYTSETAAAYRSGASTAEGADYGTAGSVGDYRPGLEAGASMAGATSYRDDASYRGSDDETIPVVEEQLNVGKRDVNRGRVRVRSYVIEEPVSENVTLSDERVSIERRPVDRALSGSEASFQDRTIEAEEHSEQAVVSKQARVTEEISLHKQSEQHQETVSDTVRHTEVEIEDDRDVTDRNSGTFDR